MLAKRGAAASDAVGQVLHQAEQPRALHRRRHQRVPRARASAVHQVGESTADQRDPPPTIVCGGQPHAKPARADVAGNFTQPLNLPEIVPPRVQRTCEVAGAGAVHSRPHARSLDGVIDPVAPSAGAGVDSASGERAQPLALQSVRAPAPKGARGSGVAKLSNCRRKQRERRQPLHRCRRPRRPAARELATPQVGDAPTQ